MRHTPGDFIDADDIARAKGRSPHARQTCPGSNVQLMEDAGKTVRCPKCLKEFKDPAVVQNRGQKCPIVPGHLPDPKGRATVEHEEARRRTQSDTPRPW